MKGNRISVLDIGGGTGWLLDQVKKVDPRVVFTQVVDCSSEAGDYARARGHCYHEGPLESFESDKSFDLILLLNIIEHVEYPVAIMKKVCNLLRPGGFLLLKTPNVDSLDARLFRHRDWGGYHCPRHWVLFTRESFLFMIRDLPLKLLTCVYTQGAPFWTVSLMTMLRNRSWIQADAEHPLDNHPLFGPVSMFAALFDFLRLPVSKGSQMFMEFRRI